MRDVSPRDGRPRRSFLFASACVALVAACSPPPPTGDAGADAADVPYDHPPFPPAQIVEPAKVQALVEPLVRDQWIPGMVVGILDARGEQYVSIGRRSIDNPAPPDADTVYEIGSITKTFTSLLLALEIERGTLTADTPVQQLLPSTVRVPAFNGRTITLHDLAVHASGLPRMPDNFAPADENNPFADYTVDALYDFLNGYTLPRAPGASMEYSNLAVGLLGHALGLHARTEWSALVQREVLEPLGLRDTSPVTTPSQLSRLAPPYDADRAPGFSWEFTDALAAAGSLRSTPRDLAHYGAFIAGLRNAPTQLLNAAITRTITPSQNWSGYKMGLGWFLIDPLITHDGATGGYLASIGVNRSAGRVVVVLTNSGSGNNLVGPVMQGVFTILNGGPPAPLSLPPLATLSTAAQERCVGRYRYNDDTRLTFTVTHDSDGVHGQLTGQPAFRLWPASETEFNLRAVDAKVTFGGADGQPFATVRVDQDGQAYSFTRIP